MQREIYTLGENFNFSPYGTYSDPDDSEFCLPSNPINLYKLNINGIYYCPYIFTTTMPHDYEEESQGMTRCTMSESLIALGNNGEWTGYALSQIKKGGHAKFEGYPTSKDPLEKPYIKIIAAYNAATHFNADMDSSEIAEEMIELYRAALIRDVQFGSTMLAPGRCFGCNEGPLVSQFLFQDVEDGQLKTYEQEYYTFQDQELTVRHIIDGLNGNYEYTDFLDKNRGKPEKIHTPRGLGSLVYGDYPGTEAVKAALISHSAGVEYAGFDNYPDRSTAWMTRGLEDVVTAIGEVARYALRVAWHAKFNDLRIRPAQLGVYLDWCEKQQSLCRGTQIYKTYSYIVKNYGFPVAPSGKRTWLLTGMYPEGAPNHPAMPSGHATVNGATTTILKAMFKTVDDNGNAITWDEATNDSMFGTAGFATRDGDRLVSTNPNFMDDVLTLTGEFNKLSINIGDGRCFAGVHFESDNEVGRLLGEDVAKAWLKNELCKYGATKAGMVTNFKFIDLHGDLIVLKPECYSHY